MNILAKVGAKLGLGAVKRLGVKAVGTAGKRLGLKALGAGAKRMGKKAITGGMKKVAEAGLKEKIQEAGMNAGKKALMGQAEKIGQTAVDKLNTKLKGKQIEKALQQIQPVVEHPMVATSGLVSSARNLAQDPVVLSNLRRFGVRGI